MNKYEIKGRLMDIIANIDDEAVLMELYKLTRDTFETEASILPTEKKTSQMYLDDSGRTYNDLPKYFSY